MNGDCCGFDELPMGEGCAVPVVWAGVEPEYCSPDFYQQSEKLATETQRHRGENMRIFPRIQGQAPQIDGFNYIFKQSRRFTESETTVPQSSQRARSISRRGGVKPRSDRRVWDFEDRTADERR
jgi:hypothetical protein